MKKHPLQRGEITLATLGLSIGLLTAVVTPIVAFYKAQAANQKDLAVVSERVTAVETFVPTIDKRLERIEKALKIVPAESLTSDAK